MKKNNKPFTPINPHQLAIFFKDTTRRVLGEIRRGRKDFIAKEKSVDYKTGQDFVTNVDRKCQEIWLKHCEEQYPFIGIIAEEEELYLPCSTKADTEYYFTIDPLDGTLAFMRGQSEGFGTMISLVKKVVKNKKATYEIIGACIGDATTQEIYYYRPESDRVHRFETGEMVRDLHHNILPLKQQYVLLREDPRKYSKTVQYMTDPQHGAFKNIEVTGGSIGTNTAKLWKGQSCAYILKTEYDTPWDSNPVAGISKKLGFKMFEILPNEYKLGKEVPLDGIVQKTKRDNERIMIHGSKIEELKKYLAQIKIK